MGEGLAATAIAATTTTSTATNFTAAAATTTFTTTATTAAAATTAATATTTTTTTTATIRPPWPPRPLGPAQGMSTERALGDDQTDATIEATCEEIERLGGKGTPVRSDAASDDDVAALMARVRDEQGRLDVLVCSAFTTPPQVATNKMAVRRGLGSGLTFHQPPNTSARGRTRIRKHMHARTHTTVGLDYPHHHHHHHPPPSALRPPRS